MHYLQYVATIVDNGIELDEQELKEEAFHAVKTTLESTLTEEGSTQWYDWFTVGGGRWQVVAAGVRRWRHRVMSERAAATVAGD